MKLRSQASAADERLIATMRAHERTLSRAIYVVAMLAVMLGVPSGAVAHDHTPFDIDGDGREDLLYQNPKSGIVRLTTVSADGLRGTSSDSLGGRTSPAHQILGAGDFDGDGRADLLWREGLPGTPRKLGFWRVNADNYTHDRSMELDTNLPAIDPAIHDLAAIGDFNGDGRSDLMFHRTNTSGTNAGGIIYWTISPSSTIQKTGTIANVPYNAYDLVGAGDFNGDGVSDLLFRNKATGGVVYWHLKSDGAGGVKLAKSGTFEKPPYRDWRVVGIGDMNKDGRSDLLFHQKSTGRLAYWLINNAGTAIKPGGSGFFAAKLNVDRFRVLGARDFNGDGRADVLYQDRRNGMVRYWILGAVKNGTAKVAKKGTYAVLAPRSTHFPASLDYFDGYARTPAPPTPIQSYPNKAVKPVVKGTVAMHARHSGNGSVEGIYDSYSNRTFFVYAGCDSYSSSAICYSHPTLKFYDHSTSTWSSNLRVADNPLFQTPGKPDSGTLADGHTYPELLLDDDHRVHVFFSGHGHPLKHWVSAPRTDQMSPTKRSTWTAKSLGSHASLGRATYVKVFKGKQGKLWVLWRDSQIANDPVGDPCVANAFDIYETWMLIGSVDDGKSWSAPQKLFDPEKGDTWDTVYLDAIKYDPGADRLHMTFKLTRFHNCYYDKFYYAYLNLQTRNVHAPTGKSLGRTVTQSEMENSKHKMVFFSEGEQAFRSHQVVLDVDRQGKPHIFHSNYNGTSRVRISHRYWTGGGWSQSYNLQPGWDDRWLMPMDVEFSDTANRYTLYLTTADVDPTPEMMLTSVTFGSYKGTRGSETKILGFKYPRLNFYEARLITDGIEPAKLFFKQGVWRNWERPKSDGVLYMSGSAGIMNP